MDHPYKTAQNSEEPKFLNVPRAIFKLIQTDTPPEDSAQNRLECLDSGIRRNNEVGLLQLVLPFDFLIDNGRDDEKQSNIQIYLIPSVIRF